MLKQLARLERTRKYTILGFAVIMAVSLVSSTPRKDLPYVEPAKSTEVIAKVGSTRLLWQIWRSSGELPADARWPHESRTTRRE